MLTSSAHKKLVANLRNALRMTDDVAFYNVTHAEDGSSILDGNNNPIEGRFPRGGPFGAALAISLNNGSLEIIGQPRGNNVVGSGIASQHAEDRALQEDNYRLLVLRLEELKYQGKEATVWMISSGQSCTTCHSKQEIMARDLLQRDLIKPGQFKNLYGATYDDTLRIAQFYDAQYADALIFAAQNPKNADNRVRHGLAELAALPAAVQKHFEQATGPVAVVVRNGEIYATGKDARTGFDLYSTAEVTAVRAACERHRKQDGVFTSWNIDGDLYTMTRERGPLLFAEIGWTGMRDVKSVTVPRNLASQHFQTQEAPRISNDAFFNVMASGYHTQEAAIGFFRDESFINRAQPMWARVLEANKQVLYNGAAVSPKILAMRDMYTRFRFAAADVVNHAKPSQPHPRIQPLAPLSSSL